MTQRRYILELAVESVRIPSCVTDVNPNDIRLSFGLTDFPVIHVAPLVPTANVEDNTISFGMAGKLCEFSLTRSQLESTNIVFLLLREVTTVNDHVVLAMTAPVLFRDLVLSLPSGPCQSSKPFAKRKFQFIDSDGECEVMLRVSNPPESGKRIRFERQSVRKTNALPVNQGANPSESPSPSVKAKQLSDSITHQIKEIGANSSTHQHYGSLRKRTPLIN
jgi:hypothetical protein